MAWLLYGANGYTGTLIARLAVASGPCWPAGRRSGPARWRRRWAWSTGCSASTTRQRCGAACARRRARTRSEVWARASVPGRPAHVTLTMPDPYDLTADSVVRAVQRLDSVPPGMHTPSKASGARYVTELDGVTLTGPG